VDSGYMGQYVSGTYYNTSAAEAGISYKAQEAGRVNPETLHIQQQASGDMGGAVIGTDRTLDAFVTVALKEAGLVSNDKTMTLVKLLLEQHMPVNKETLVAYNRLMTQNPGVDISTLISMQKNNISITPTIIEQFENYKANEHQLMKDIGNVADDISNVLKDLFSDNKNAAATFLDGIGQFVDTMGADRVGQMLEQSAGDEAMLKFSLTAKAEATATNNVADDKNAILTAFSGDETMVFAGNDAVTLKDTVALKANLLNELVRILPDTDTKGVLQQMLAEKLSNEEGREKLNITDKEFFGTLARVIEELPKDKVTEFFEKLDTKEFKQIVREALDSAVFMNPEEAADKDKTVKYYRRLGEALLEITETMGRLGEKAQDSAVGKTFNRMADNVSFMNQINEWIPYIQLPIKIIEDKAHGDFYVMKRKKAFQRGETLTAFLRLNMEYLGELDIMVKLKDKSLDIDIKAEKKDIVAFIESNLPRLDKGLKLKGYNPTMSVGEKEKDFDFEKDFLEADNAEGTIGRYSFDMKI